MHYRLLYYFITLCVLKYGTCYDYEAEFNDDVHSCKDFTNDKFQADLSLAYSDDASDSVAMEGTLKVKEEIVDGVFFDVEILKATGTAAGYESMIHMKSDLCESVKDEDAPWSTLFESMGVSSCPIAAGTYDIQKLQINLNFTKGLSGDNYAGDYDVVIKLIDAQQNDLSCHMVDVQVSEV